MPGAGSSSQGVDRGRRPRRAAVVPYVADAYWLLLAINILTYVALATAWAFFSGPTRYVSLAASAFYGLGAYCVAVLASDYSYPVALIAAVGLSVVLSALVGLATLRLSGMYFVIFTFGLASLVSAAATWWEFNIAKSSGWYVYLSITDKQIFYQLLALCAAIIALWLWRDRTRMGFALTTLGADETVARQIGINTVALKIGTFVVSAVVMALAGAILAPKNSYVTAQSVFNPEVSFLTVIGALLGGATSVWGPVLGVVPLLLVKDYLSIAYSSHFSVLLGIVLLGIVFFIPDGLIGLLRNGGARRDQRRMGSPIYWRRRRAVCAAASHEPPPMHGHAANGAAAPPGRPAAAPRHPAGRLRP